jgi:hypothetical protein
VSISGHSWTTDFIGDVIGNPISFPGDPSKLFADVEISPAPTPEGIGSVVRVVDDFADWPPSVVSTFNARVHVVGKLWTTANGLIRCTPTSITAV